MSTQNRVAESGRAGARAGEWALSRASGGHGRRLTTRHACKTRNGKTGGGRTNADGRGRTNGRQARLKLRRRRRPNQPINRFATSPPPFIRCTAGYNGIEFVEAETYILQMYLTHHFVFRPHHWASYSAVEPRTHCGSYLTFASKKPNGRSSGPPLPRVLAFVCMNYDFGS